MSSFCREKGPDLRAPENKTIFNFSLSALAMLVLINPARVQAADTSTTSSDGSLCRR